MLDHRIGVVLALAAMVSMLAVSGAEARRFHRHRVAHRGPHTFVFRSPDAATVTSNAGKVAGYLLPGIMGATTADPYEHPGYGYYVGGGRGPGYFYPD